MKRFPIHPAHKAVVAILLLMALCLSACSPYRVHKRAPTHGKASNPSILDFRRSSCGCN